MEAGSRVADPYLPVLATKTQVGRYPEMKTQELQSHHETRASFLERNRKKAKSPSTQEVDQDAPAPTEKSISGRDL